MTREELTKMLADEEVAYFETTDVGEKERLGSRILYMTKCLAALGPANELPVSTIKDFKIKWGEAIPAALFVRLLADMPEFKGAYELVTPLAIMFSDLERVLKEAK